MNVSFLITSKDRIKYFPKTWESIRRYITPEDELVVVEDGSFDWDPYLATLGVPYQFYKTNSTKYRSCVFAKNIGLKRCKNEIVCIQETEVIHVTEFYYAMKESLEKDTKQFLVPDILYSEKYKNCPFYDCDVIHNQMAPFVGMTTKQNLMDIGGWDERFTFWGNDDNDLMHRLVLNGISHKTMQGTILHQYHDRPPRYAMGDCNHDILYEKDKSIVANVGKEWGVL